MKKNNNSTIQENNKYFDTYTKEPLGTYTPDAFVKMREMFNCKPLTKKAADESKVEKQKEQFLDRYVCPHCGKRTSWVKDTNIMVCTNPDCPGEEIKNSKGEVVTSHSTYHTLNHRGESIATTLLS